LSQIIFADCLVVTEILITLLKYLLYLKKKKITKRI